MCHIQCLNHFVTFEISHFVITQYYIVHSVYINFKRISYEMLVKAYSIIIVFIIQKKKKKTSNNNNNNKTANQQ